MLEGDKMIIKAKINKKYMDEIIAGRKQVEYRQIEYMELTDGERTIRVGINMIHMLSPMERESVEKCYSDINWVYELPIFRFVLDTPKVIE